LINFKEILVPLEQSFRKILALLLEIAIFDHWCICKYVHICLWAMLEVFMLHNIWYLCNLLDLLFLLNNASVLLTLDGWMHNACKHLWVLLLFYRSLCYIRFGTFVTCCNLLVTKCLILIVEDSLVIVHVLIIKHWKECCLKS